MSSCQSNIDCTEKQTLLFKKNGFAIVECKQCTRRFSSVHDVESHLSQVYSDDYFFDGKDGYPNYLEERDLLIKYGTYYARLINRHRNPGKILDVGCAAGFILKGFEQSGWSCYGVEPNATMASYAMNELNLDIQIGSLETYKTNVKFDLITLIQVIGHFYNVQKAIENVSRLLENDGLVLIESWNMNSLVAKLLGKHWHEYSPPSVINWFSDKTLTLLLRNYGLERIDSGYPAKHINLKHALSLLESRTPNIFLKKRIMHVLNDSIGNITLNYPPVDLKWYLFRKQVNF